MRRGGGIVMVGVLVIVEGWVAERGGGAFV